MMSVVCVTFDNQPYLQESAYRHITVYLPMKQMQCYYLCNYVPAHVVYTQSGMHHYDSSNRQIDVSASRQSDSLCASAAKPFARSC
jgi:hypothetical protein